MERVKYANSRGHQTASYTWSGKDLATLDPKKIDEEMFRVNQAIERITGARVAFMRPPCGSYNQQVLDVAGKRG